MAPSNHDALTASSTLGSHAHLAHPARALHAAHPARHGHPRPRPERDRAPHPAAGARRRAWRATIGAVALVSIVAVPSAVGPVPALAGCGTAWDSTRVPPPTIRVLRTGSGKVDTVDFRRYVAEVMASGEWPTHMPVAELEVGAVATKQYAWYYTLAGHHRSSYRTASGACYDVRDDTNDQLYRPERTSPTPKQQAAVERTWALTLRKHGRFFLTGYRAGTVSRCAADANGWKLYAASIRDCADRLGWGRERILSAYLNPGLTEVWSDQRDEPDVSRPAVRVASGGSFPGEAADVRWRPRGDRVVTRYEVQRRVNSGAWRNVTLADPLALSTRVQLWGNRKHQFRARAHTAKGPTAWATGPTIAATLREPTRTMLVGTDWQTEASPGAVGGRVTFASSTGNRTRVRFTGRSIGWIATTGPDMGQARVLVDGREIARVDLFSEAVEQRQLVWSHTWSRARTRTLVIEVVSVAARVEVDGLLVLR